MAKLGWDIVRNNNKIKVKIMNARYLKSTSFMNYTPKQGDSSLYRDILKDRYILEQGLCFRVRNGDVISLW